MKKIMALVLATVMVLCTFPVAIAAETQQEELTKYPVIMVPGYTSSSYYKIDEATGEKIMVWGDAAGQVVSGAQDGMLEKILAEAAKFFVTGDATQLASILGSGFRRIFAACLLSASDCCFSSCSTTPCLTTFDK